MLRITELRMPLAHAPEELRPAIVRRLGIHDDELRGYTIFKRSWDARKKTAVVLIYTIDADLGEAEAALLTRHAGDRHLRISPDMRYRGVAQAPLDFYATPRAGFRHRPVVIGFGPCGIFAALVLAQMGLAPIVLERGREVRQRTKDTWGLWRHGVLDPESNVQFGEGGAGTFSDGKLWSQISDPRHLTRKVLDEFVRAGAPEEILFVAKPHIGTFRLVSMVEKMRADIVALGGEVRFEQRVTDIRIEDGRVRGVVIANHQTERQTERHDGHQHERQHEPEELRTDHVVLALGHSARDTFEMLHRRGVVMQAKPFSLGLRVEHPQSLVDRARYGPNAGNAILGAADYKLVHHASNGRSVYSFCMCPGGTVVAATSEARRVVTNGMSQYSRHERNANAGIVVGVAPQDYRQDGLSGGTVSPLDGITFQRFWESRAYQLGGENYQAPGQLLGDFVAGRHGSAVTREFGSVLPSYQPGVRLTDLNEPGRGSLPADVLAAIRQALPAFERQLPGFAMADAVLTGVETRTSSPLRMPRGQDFQSVNVAGLYPAGEGAGYAGGIMSAAVDGIEVAEALGAHMLQVGTASS